MSLPKDPSKRRRRNVSPGRTVLRVVEPPKRRRPALGRRRDRRAWLPSTREWWQAIWESPLATQWLEVDVWGLRRLAELHDAIGRGEGTAALIAEARQQEANFGLSPLARRRLDWSIEVAPEVDRPPTSQALDDTRWLHAVKDSE